MDFTLFSSLYTNVYSSENLYSLRHHNTDTMHGCLICIAPAQFKISSPPKIKESFFFLLFWKSAWHCITHKVIQRTTKSNLKAQALMTTSCTYAVSHQSTEHDCTAPLRHNAGEGQAAEGRDLQTAFKKKKKKLIEGLCHSLMYSQFTSGLSIKNQIRSSPPHHYCRTLQSSSATTVQHSATGR